MDYVIDVHTTNMKLWVSLLTTRARQYVVQLVILKSWTELQIDAVNWFNNQIEPHFPIETANNGSVLAVS